MLPLSPGQGRFRTRHLLCPVLRMEPLPDDPCCQMNALSVGDVLEAIQSLLSRDDGVARTFFGSGESGLK